MSRKNVRARRDWSPITSQTGEVLGQYSVQDGMITVRHPSGDEKTTHVGHPDAIEGLAPLMLSEFRQKGE